MDPKSIDRDNGRGHNVPSSKTLTHEVCKVSKNRFQNCSKQKRFLVYKSILDEASRNAGRSPSKDWVKFLVQLEKEARDAILL